MCSYREHRDVAPSSERHGTKAGVLQARTRFGRAQRVVRTVLHCVRALVDISDSLTSRTAVEDQWYELNNSREVKKLAFNPAVFAKSRVCIQCSRESSTFENSVWKYGSV